MIGKPVNQAENGTLQNLGSQFFETVDVAKITSCKAGDFRLLYRALEFPDIRIVCWGWESGDPNFEVFKINIIFTLIFSKLWVEL